MDFLNSSMERKNASTARRGMVIVRFWDLYRLLSTQYTFWWKKNRLLKPGGRMYGTDQYEKIVAVALMSMKIRSLYDPARFSRGLL
jgi:hypothetical protein